MALIYILIVLLANLNIALNGIYCSNHPDMILTVIMVVPGYYRDIYNNVEWQ